MRTDIHRPSEIVPDDYVFVACEYLKIEHLGDALFLQEQRELIHRHMARTSGTYSRHQHGGNCHVCGSVNLIYSILYYHEPSNSYIRVGEDCASKLDMGGQKEINKFRAAVHDALQAKAGIKKAQAVLAESNLSRAWEIYEAFKPPFIDPFDNHARRQSQEEIIWDIIGKLVKYGSISVNQEAFLGKLINQIDQRAEFAAKRALENADAAPCPSGRVTINGVIISTKTQDSDWGVVTKMLVKADSGYKVWVTSPGGSKGDRVTFSATLTPSRDDTKFGFGSRPTKFQVIETAPVKA